MTDLKVMFKEYYQDTCSNFNTTDTYHAVRQEDGNAVVVQHGNGHTVKVQAAQLHIHEVKDISMKEETTFKVKMIKDFHTRTHIFKQGEEYDAVVMPGEFFKYYVKFSEGKHSVIGVESLFRVAPELENGPGSLDAGKNANCVIQIRKDFNCGSGIFLAGQQYHAWNTEGLTTAYAHIPKGTSYSIPPDMFDYVSKDEPTKILKDGEDCWGYIVQETGIERQNVKQFFFMFWQGEMTILEIARKLALSAFSIQHLMLSFDQWSGASD